MNRFPDTFWTVTDSCFFGTTNSEKGMKTRTRLFTNSGCIAQAPSAPTHLPSMPPDDHECNVPSITVGSVCCRGEGPAATIFHKPTPTLQAMQLLDAQAAVDNEWEKLEKLPAWHVTKNQEEQRGDRKGARDRRTVHFATLMALCHLKNTEPHPSHQRPICVLPWQPNIHHIVHLCRSWIFLRLTRRKNPKQSGKRRTMSREDHWIHMRSKIPR